MDAQIKKLRKLVKFCREQGVLSVKTSEIELSLAPAALFPKVDNVPHGTSETIETDEMAPEDILLWSAPGVEPNA